MTEMKIKKTDPRAIIPAYGSEYSAGCDLHVVLDEPVVIAPGETYLFHIGVAMEIPDGLAGLVFPRSGIATRRGLALANKVGVIDSDYRGEIMVPLFNHSSEPQTVEPGERIAQMVFVPYVTAEWIECEELSETERGTGGFGSTGTR